MRIVSKSFIKLVHNVLERKMFSYNVHSTNANDQHTFGAIYTNRFLAWVTMKHIYFVSQCDTLCNNDIEIFQFCVALWCCCFKDGHCLIICDIAHHGWHCLTSAIVRGVWSQTFCLCVFDRSTFCLPRVWQKHFVRNLLHWKSHMLAWPAIMAHVISFNSLTPIGYLSCIYFRLLVPFEVIITCRIVDKIT